MTQTYDITLNGAGYMLVPPPERAGGSGSGATSYRLEVRIGVPVAVRTGIREWQLAPGAGDETRWRADSLVPEVSGYGGVAPGLVLGPAVRTAAYIGVVMAAAQLFNGALYVASGTTLYKVTLSGGAFSSFAGVGNVSAGTITAMWVWNARLWLACSAPATTYASTDGVTITNATGTATASAGFGYGRANWLVQRDTPTGLRATFDGGATWTYFQVEGSIRSVLPTGRSVLVLHTAGIDEITGSFVDSTSGGTTTTAFSGSVLPLVRTTGAGAAGDYAWAVDFGGRVYTWFGGTVCAVERSTITGGRVVPVAGAPRGAALAAVVSAGRLWVALTAAQVELWSYGGMSMTGGSAGAVDGARWVRHLVGGATVGVLASLAGIASDADVMLFQATAPANVYALLTQAVGQTAYPASAGSVTLGPWDAGKPDDAKTWSEVEIVWAVPERAAAPSGAVLVESSVNGGATWITAGTTTITGGTGGTIRQPLAGVSGETVSVRVTWTPTANGTGFRLVSVYANGWELPAAPALRRWEARVRCSDKLIRRDGSLDVRSGEAMRAALLALAAGGAPVPFQDLDYDANPITTTVRVVGVQESVRRGDGTHFWESEAALTLEAIP